jgi:hypothetical protein
VNGTLIQASASVEIFRRKDRQDEPPALGRNGARDVHQDKPANETHASTSDPEGRLYRKGRGKEAKLSFMGAYSDGQPAWAGGGCDADDGPPAPPNESRRWPCWAICRIAAITVGADKAYGHGRLRGRRPTLKLTPHAARSCNERPGSNIDGRTPRTPAMRSVSHPQESRGGQCAHVGKLSATLRSPEPDIAALLGGGPIAWSDLKTRNLTSVNEIVRAVPKVGKKAARGFQVGCLEPLVKPLVNAG